MRYANTLGLAVEFRANAGKKDLSYCDPSEHRIVLHVRPDLQESTYVLLHEMGHYEYHHKAWVKKVNPVLDRPGLSSQKQYKTSHLVEVVETEFKAWEIAEKIAQRLDIKIDRRKFELVKAEALGTYLKGAGKEMP